VTEMAKKKLKNSDPEVKIICRNRRARHDYDIQEEVEAGLVLTGSEVKSLRVGRADLVDGYANIKDGELFLVSVHIAPYDKAARFGHEPKRMRKLLVQRKVIKRFEIKIRERGFTIVPLEMYFRRGWAKVRLGLAKGKKQYDNREQIRREEDRRALRRMDE
jgi:SsrA-binding protein